MTITHSISISTPQSAVFALYENVASWPAWDCETEAVFLPDGLHRGSTGWLKPRKGPKARVRVAEVLPGRSFTMEGQLPLCRMHFGHDLRGDGQGTTATHWVRFSGPLGFLFRRLIGREIDATLPATLLGLKHACENRAESE
ncbi:MULTISPECIES: SRPBCC family protein [Phaeobacter]|uniref:Polyketide cyclase / dehydrase and lipid transport n=1 Tax=Phaeobacter piscinae TaxID=1580596 RepID=A0ABN5DEL9_9RHOB|nr:MULTISPECIES: SRPBCC family protein [Phaeobacter]ATG35852.1 Polyketide cyclase / dehydrase and lipid transport [Phaeobacter piscinae]ATG39916.1 Polyketide cyclase / dehydrase and lipid transport [Phaeobacter piscinae]AUQ86373.1 Polyketide cyclase / dehydrase and lipid transport [Phaeobacter piscinae]AUR24256.1 Polyketide cyclase / dehydrase and lipid transport [Phaeobacter piscinae]KII13682.1 hypothetical protein OO25_15325 [Phaeobacter sp. S60]